MFTVAIDMGGTFTDLVVADETENVQLFKVASVPGAPVEGIMNAVKLAADHYGYALTDFLHNTEALIVGTTMATNAVLTSKVAKTGLIINEGFEDLLTVGLGSKGKSTEDMFRSHMAYPEPFIPRYLTVGVPGRINAEGGVETDLDEDQVRAAVSKLKQWNVESFAICTLWSHVNPDHENRIAAIVGEESPGTPCSVSSTVNPVIREYERTSTTAIDASLKPIFSNYVYELGRALTEQGYQQDLLMTNSNGGVMKADELAALPICAIKSGPSMGPAAGLYLAEQECLGNNVLVCDMGGTTFDASLTVEGRIASTSVNRVGPYHYNLPCVEVNSIGAGGGSIAWVDTGGLLHVGPTSAGASPGPACYGFGGDQPTVTDADVVLGYINPDYFLGGEMDIAPELASDAIKDRLVSVAGIDVVETAALIYVVANQSMVKGLEEVTTRRGIDPRACLLIGGGGACGTHIVPMAQELGIARILIPRMAAGLCAYGMLIGDIIYQRARGMVTSSRDFDFTGVNKAITELEEGGLQFLTRANIAPDKCRLEFSVSARYPYQAWELDFLLPWNRVTPKRLEQLVNLFHAAHEERYGFRVDHPVECVSFMVKAIGSRSQLSQAKAKTEVEDGSTSIKGWRDAYCIERKEFVSTPIYAGDRLRRGNRVRGPAIIEELQTTVVIPEHSQATVTRLGNYLIDVGYEAAGTDA